MLSPVHYLTIGVCGEREGERGECKLELDMQRCSS